jgi:hypothetical protein
MKTIDIRIKFAGEDSIYGFNFADTELLSELL